MKYLFLLVVCVAIGNARGQSVPGPSPKGLRPYEKVITKDAVAWHGPFTVHQVRDSFFFEIPDTLFNRDFMVIHRYVQTPYAKGLGFLNRKYPGETTDGIFTPDGQVVYFAPGSDGVLNLFVDNQRVQADRNSRLAGAVRQSLANPIRATLPIVANGLLEGSIVVDATAFMKGHFVSDMGTAGANDRRRVQYVHAFPVNIEVGIYNEGGFSRNITVTNTSFLLLPKELMTQRIFDRRVGFFDDKTNYFSDEQQAVEQRRFIVRWRLEPRPEDRERWQRGELVEPAKPIVFYIDPHTPKQWVKYLILGVNDWQKAFEQAGFKNAIMAMEWPYGDSANLQDARYSFICYLPSETMNAYGPNVHDPRSGQIIQTHVGWYHNVMTLVDYWYRSQVGATDPAARRPVFDDELMGQLIRFVSSHEVGHTLGLRHNFGSSSKTPVEKMRDRDWLKAHGHTASIMDYARFNYVAQPEDSIPQSSLWPHINEYDRWAIQWGYTYTGLSAEADKKVLHRLATDSLAANPQLWYGSQEAEKQSDPFAPPDDPRSQTEDLGSNNMVANAYGIKNLKRVVPNLTAWTKEQGGLYDNLSEAYQALLGQFKRYVGHVFRHIGGVERTWRSEEEGGDVYAPVSKVEQKQALAFLNEQLFTTPLWLLDPGIINKVVKPQSKDAIGELQQKVVKQLLGTEIFNKLLAGSSQFGDSLCYPLPEYMADLHRYIWGGLPTGRPMDAYRRNLQKSYISALAEMIVLRSQDIEETDIWSVAKADLAQIAREVTTALPKYTAGADQAHLKTVLLQIRRINNFR
jgi:hypothetical protein